MNISRRMPWDGFALECPLAAAENAKTGQPGAKDKK
jgi:hypothetical protein